LIIIDALPLLFISHYYRWPHAIIFSHYFALLPPLIIAAMRRHATPADSFSFIFHLFH
jgi:hypothetical protein